MQRSTWGVDDLSVVPLTQLSAAQHVGGTLLGAFDGERLVGFAYGFYGHVGGKIVHHSHMLAVDPGYRNHDLGFRLKVEQLKSVRADGIADRITWTFDPLRSLNAHFNFSKLGVVSDNYEVNVYGENAASFLHRTGTDRLFVTWLINSRRVARFIGDESVEIDEIRTSDPEADTLLRCSEAGLPVREASIGGQDRLAIEIPADIGAIEDSDLDAARLWRGVTRHAFLEALRAGFLVTDYRLNDDRSGSYLLRKMKIEEFG